MLILLSKILLISAIVYSFFIILFLIGTLLKNTKTRSDSNLVSVVIAARNEEDCIGHILSDLLNQTYPKDKFEVIVVNDQSSDKTAAVVKKIARENPFIRLVNACDDENGLLTAKKNAIQQGILASKGEIILSTDADCRVKSTWIETMVSYFNEDVGMIVGFSQIGQPDIKQSHFENLQAIDFLALLTAAQGSLNLNIPLAATGQNIAYRKSTFEEVGGFKQIGHRISGDDVLLLQLIHKNTNWNIRFAPDEKSFNYTFGEKKLKRFLSQRNRWASNGSYQLKLNKLFFIILANTLIMNLLLLTLTPISCFYTAISSTVLMSLLLKIAIELIVILRGTKLYNRRELIKYFPVWTLLEIPYTVFVGVIGNLGKFIWKGRRN